MSDFIFGGAFGSIAEIKQYTGKKRIVGIPRQSDRREPITRIGDGAFRNCKTVESIIIPNSVTSIGKYAFSGCSNLTSIVLPDSITYIGEDAFMGCANLASISVVNARSIQDYEKGITYKLVADIVYNIIANYEDSLEWYIKAAELGNADAMVKIGYMYYTGTGVQENKSTAAEWFRKSAEAGNAKAMYDLGLVYYNGFGVPEDKGIAAEWYEKAASAGDYDSMRIIGNMYYYGDGVEQDKETALEWYIEAAENQDEEVIYIIGRMYYDGDGIEQDNSSAQEWFEKGEALGSQDSINALLEMKANGDYKEPEKLDLPNDIRFRAYKAGYSSKEETGVEESRINSVKSEQTHTAKTRKASKASLTKFSKVDFSVLTEESVKSGSQSFVDVLMYTKNQRGIVDKLLRKKEDKKKEAAKSLISIAVRHGSNVTVILQSDDAVVENAAETLTWNGNILDFKFRFTIPEEYKKSHVDFSCEVLFDGIHITRLFFSVKLNTAKSVPIKLVRKDSRKAFVSYSHRDKQKVVDKIIAIQEVAPRIRFWMDNQSMTAGEVWRNEIASAIKSSDVFLLFWSSHAKASSEVEKEWRYALELEKVKSRRRNGSRFITPVPLETPSECPPPDELANLHFGDPSFDADVEGIENVRFVSKNSKLRNIRRIG